MSTHHAKRPHPALPVLTAMCLVALAGSCGGRSSRGAKDHIVWKLPGALIEGRDGRAYIQEYTRSLRNLSRVELATGRFVWTGDVLGQLQPDCAYADVLVTVAEGRAQGIDPETGRALWSMAAEEIEGEGTPLVTCPAEGTTFYAVQIAGYNALAAFAKNSGVALWRYSPGGYLAIIHADEDLVLVERGPNAEESLVALDAATGKRRWSVPRQGQSNAYAHGGVPFLVTGETLAKIDRRTGAVAWSTSLGDGPLSVRFEGDAILVSSEGKEARLDPANGVPIFEREPAHSEEKLLSDDLDGSYRLRANRDFSRLTSPEGRARWSYPVDVFGELLAADARTVYISLLDVGPWVRTTVVALDRRTGRERWRQKLHAAATLVTQNEENLYFATTSPEAGTMTVAVRKR